MVKKIGFYIIIDQSQIFTRNNANCIFTFNTPVTSYNSWSFQILILVIFGLPAFLMLLTVGVVSIFDRIIG